MSFPGWPIEQPKLGERISRRRKALAMALISKFAEVFKEIEYELLWDVPTINAQAWRVGNERHVSVYGGFRSLPWHDRLWPKSNLGA